MVSEGERDAALAELLVAQVEGEGHARRRPAAPTDGRPSRGPDRFRGWAVTGVVAAAVVAVSAYALGAQVAAPNEPAATDRPSAGATPVPGEVLALFRSEDGRTQTKPVAANGSALQIDWSCDGGGTIDIVVPGGPSVEDGQCDGTTTLASPVGVPGTVAATVTVSGSAVWTVSIEAIATHGRGVLLPGDEPARATATVPAR